MVLSETMDDLVVREGLYYKKFTDVPFTGKITGITKGSFKKGKKEGAWFHYKRDGTLDKRTGTYKNGKKIRN